MHQLSTEDIKLLNTVFDLAREGKAQAVASLIDQGVPVNLTDSKGDTLLILATYHQHPALVSALLERGADLNRLNDRGQTALVCAVFRDNQTIAAQLLAAGADPSLGTQSPAAVADFFHLPRMQQLLHDHETAQNTPRPQATDT